VLAFRVVAGKWAANHGHHLLRTVSRRHRTCDLAASSYAPWPGNPARAPLAEAQRTAGRRRLVPRVWAELPLDRATQRVLTDGTPCSGTYENSYLVPAKCSTAVARRPTGSWDAFRGHVCQTRMVCGPATRSERAAAARPVPARHATDARRLPCRQLIATGPDHRE
jgi:hypothetical protein